ncbi:hypothetical protein SO802_010879 [Lithocarpus litseifolius]|uniref:Uncharacterized protein n=1 Tax=Lithocarpus litseifolius TaxID=425828 RepID=A0AAW2DHN6_9ROSI
MQKKSNGNNEGTCFKVVFRRRHISSEFDQDVLIFFEGGYKLKSEESSSLTKFWAIEKEPKSNPSLKVEPIPKSGRPKCIEDRQGIWDLIILWYRAIDNYIVRFPQPPWGAKQLGKSYLGNPD